MRKRILNENNAKEEQKMLVREHCNNIKKRKDKKTTLIEKEQKRLEKERIALENKRKKDFEAFVQRVPPKPKSSLPIEPPVPMPIDEALAERLILIPSVEPIFSETDLAMLELTPVGIAEQRSVMRRIFDLLF